MRMPVIISKLLNHRSILLLLACVLAMPAARAAQDPEEQFRRAMALREQGDLFEAVEVFQSILGTDPSLQRARLELAVTYYRALRFKHAEEEATAVLNDPGTPPNVKLAILAFLGQVSKDVERFDGRRHQWKLSIVPGYIHDDNVNVGPGSDVVRVGDSSLRLVAGSTPRGDSAYTLLVGVDHDFQPGTQLRLGQRQAALHWLTQASAYRKGYFKEYGFDLDVVSLSTGPALTSLGNWRAGLDLRGDYIRLGNDYLGFYTSLLPSVTWQFGRNELTLKATVSRRDYKQAVDEPRDSNYWSGGVNVGRSFMDNKAAVQAGVGYFEEHAAASRFDRDGTELFISGNARPWKGGMLYARASQRDTDHDGPEPLFGIARDERERHYVAGLRHTFRRQVEEGSVWLKDWTFDASFSRTDNDSNVGIYTYDRDQYSLSVSRTF